MQSGSPPSQRAARSFLPTPLIAFLALIAAAAACGPAAPPQPIEPQAAASPQTTYIIITNTPGFTAIPSETPSPFLTETPLPSATPRETITPRPTSSPFPSLAPLVAPSAIATNTLPAPLVATSTQPARTPTSVTATPGGVPSGGTAGSSGEGSDIVADGAGNRLQNPGFEGSVRGVIFGEINVFQSWEPFYCDQPYTSGQCPAPRPCPPGQTFGCNPPELRMGRPEYKPSDVPNRVHSGGTAQQWFCFFRTCQAGVFQTFATTPGAQCEVGAYVQSWSNFDSDIESDGLDTADGRDNSRWFIKVDPAGGINAFASNLIVSRAFTYTDGHYDKYVKIRMTFTATSDRTTVFFENFRLWPIDNNDNYIDDAYAICR